jgi:hypothetical protein
MARVAKAASIPKTDVVKAPAQQLVMPDFMKGTAGQGLEGIDRSDIETPRLLLLQPTSSQVTDYENARQGMFWHNMLNEPVGDAKTGFEGVIIYVDKRAILWRPRPPIDTGGILARTDDLRAWNPSNASFQVKLKTGRTVEYHTGRSVASSGLLDWGTSDPSDPNSVPAGTLMINCVLFFPALPHIPPAVFSFQRASQKVSRKLMGRLNLLPCASYGVKFRFGSDLTDIGGNKFYIPTFDMAGFVEDQEEFMLYQNLYQALSKSGLKMREEPDDVDTATAYATGDEPEY